LTYPTDGAVTSVVVTVGSARVDDTDCPSDADLPAATIVLVARLQQATG
jgi:hypothetical protein